MTDDSTFCHGAGEMDGQGSGSKRNQSPVRTLFEPFFFFNLSVSGAWGHASEGVRSVAGYSSLHLRFRLET